MKTGLTIKKGPFGGFMVQLDEDLLGTTGTFGTEDELLAKARTFADGAAAAIFATTGAIISIEEATS